LTGRLRLLLALKDKPPSIGNQPKMPTAMILSASVFHALGVVIVKFVLFALALKRNLVVLLYVGKKHNIKPFRKPESSRKPTNGKNGMIKEQVLRVHSPKGYDVSDCDKHAILA